MSEPEVADTLAAAIDADEADVYIVNFANPDMVGHTASFPPPSPPSKRWIPAWARSSTLSAARAGSPS